MEVLVDHSGYELLNLGDIAMLQSCVRRLERLMPSARLRVLCHDAERMATYCPTVDPVVIELPYGAGRVLPPRPRRTLEFGCKAFDPVAATSRRAAAWNPAARAARRADVVIGSGGGYVTDQFWVHGAGVLATLGFAQRAGRPTAMFGQGLGPVSSRPLRRMAQRVLPRLRVLGLRERVTAAPVLASAGMAGRAELTGDDALAMAMARAGAGRGAAVGVNVRVVGYTGVDEGVARDVGSVIGAVAAGEELIVLPVSRDPGHDDLETTARGLRSAGLAVTAPDIHHPAELVDQVGRCAAVVTTSYHVAVFALAQGRPAVCLTSTAYYDGKVAGLQDLYGSACGAVDLREPGWRDALRAALDRALDVPESVREGARTRSSELAAAGEALYERFVGGLCVS